MSKRKSKKKEYKLHIGENIRKWRQFKDLQQVDLANMLEIEACTLSKIECDYNSPNTNMLEDIAEALGIEVEFLLKSPQQIFILPQSINNNSSAVIEAQKVYSNEIPLMEKILFVMDAILKKLGGGGSKNHISFSWNY